MARLTFVSAMLAVLSFAACSRQPVVASNAVSQEQSRQSATVQLSAPPPSSTGGFDGAQAFEHVRHLVAIGARPPGSDGIHQAQAYIIEHLKSYGCRVEQNVFH